MDVQGRFEQVHDSPYGEVKASMLTAVAAKDNVSATVEVKNIHLFWDNAPKYLVVCVIQKRKILFYLVLHENASLFFSSQA